MAISYSVHIDRDDDGDFDDSGEDISSDVLALDWRLGMDAPHQSVAETGRATIRLRNRDQSYSPEINALLPGQTLRIQSDDASTLRTHFVGQIERVEVQPGDQGQREAVIHAVDASWPLSGQPLRLAPQVDVHADDVIESVLDAVPLRRTVLDGIWLLGRVDHSELGTNTRLAGITLPRSLESGITVFSYVGDTWGEGIAAADAIRQVVEAERGRFFMDRSGQAVFYNRHHLLSDSEAAASFADDMQGLSYAYGADVFSEVQVRLLPRSLGTAGSEIWALGEAQRFAAGDVRQVVARFRDAEDQPMGALGLIPPQPGSDYSANSAADGSGEDLSDQVDIHLRASDFSAAVLEIRNRATVPVYLLAGARLRGRPVYAGDPLLLRQVSDYSQAVYGPRSLRLDIPALNHIEQADSLARYELSRRKTPRGQVTRLNLDARYHTAQVLARTLFDRIAIEESQSGHSADYFIVGESHQVDLGGYRHRVSWTLEPAEANHFWLLGRDLLNQTTVLAY